MNAGPPPERRVPVRLDVDRAIGAFESETAAVFQAITPRRQHLVLYTLIGILAISLLLAGVVKLDKVVTGAGRIVPTAGALYVSPFDTGIVRQVLVKAGDTVRKGQVLATLDSTFTEADVRQLQQKEATDRAIIARLDAEGLGKNYRAAKGEAAGLLQEGIFRQRRAEYRSNLSDFDSRIRGAESQGNQFHANAREYAKRYAVAAEVEKSYAPLAEKGYVTKLQQAQAADQVLEMQRLRDDAQNQEATARQSLAALQAQREAFVQKWHSDGAAELVTTNTDLEATRQSLQKARKLSELGSLEAPADAIVLKVARVSSGSVAGGGGVQSQGQEPLFTLIPLDAPLEAEIHVAAEHIGFVKVGDPVEIKLDAYRFLQHGTAKGTIRTISEGSFTLDDNNVPVAPFFKVSVHVTDAKLRNVPPDFRLIPGMTLAGDVIVGSRTILSYLVEGGLRTGAEAMREP